MKGGLFLPYQAIPNEFLLPAGAYQIVVLREPRCNSVNLRNIKVPEAAGIIPLPGVAPSGICLCEDCQHISEASPNVVRQILLCIHSDLDAV